MTERRRVRVAILAYSEQQSRSGVFLPPTGGCCSNAASSMGMRWCSACLPHEIPGMFRLISWRMEVGFWSQHTITRCVVLMYVESLAERQMGR